MPYSSSVCESIEYSELQRRFFTNFNVLLAVLVVIVIALFRVDFAVTPELVRLKNASDSSETSNRTSGCMFSGRIAGQHDHPVEAVENFGNFAAERICACTQGPS